LGIAHLRARNRGAQLEALLHAREHALASGDLRRQIEAWDEVGGAMLFGRTPLTECKEFIEAELEWAREHGLPAVEADALLVGPYCYARVGDFELAREMLNRSKAISRDLGLTYRLCEAGMAGSELETLAGDLAAAERELVEAMDLAADMGAAQYVALYRVRLSRVLNEQGRHDEAAGLLDEAAELYAGLPWWKSNRARVLAARGAVAEAVALAGEAAAQEAGSDDITAVAQTLVDVSEVLRAAADRTGAEAALTEAIVLNEEKGNVVAAERCRERLARLRPGGVGLSGL
jgi:tetratricopeptide (TPR) repeat protein